MNSNANTAENNDMQSEEHSPEVPETDEQVIAEGPVTSEEPASPETLANEANTGNDWESKFKEMNDRYLRLYSEFDNFRKRTARERIELSKTAAADIFTAILPVLDDFERAAKAMENATEVAVVKEGMQLIHTKFHNTLLNRGLEAMKSVGEEFNADIHEAITQIPVPDESMKGKVMDEVEKGYLLHGKVIRFAKVIVGS